RKRRSILWDAAGRTVKMFKQHAAHWSRASCKAIYHDINRLIAQFAEETRLPVVQRTLGEPGIEHAVDRGVGYGPDHVHDWWSEILERFHCRLAGLGAAAVADHQCCKFGAGTVWRMYKSHE